MQHTAEYVLHGMCNCIVIVFAVLGHLYLRFSYGKLQYQSVQEAICKLEQTQDSTT